MKQLRHHLTELAGREGSVVDGKLEEALDYTRQELEGLLLVCRIGSREEVEHQDRD